MSIKSVFPKEFEVEVYFNKFMPIIKPMFESSNTLLDHNWIAGFIQADGTFGLNYTKAPRMKLGYTSQPQFRVTQHERDLIEKEL